MAAPDRTKIAYAADFGEGSHGLYIQDLAGDPASQMQLSEPFIGDPDWDPTSTWLAFTRSAQSTFGAGPYIGDIVTVGADGSGMMNLTMGTIVAADPKFDGLLGSAHASVFIVPEPSSLLIAGIGIFCMGRRRHR